jgi:hypothetical protein
MMAFWLYNKLIKTMKNYKIILFAVIILIIIILIIPDITLEVLILPLVILFLISLIAIWIKNKKSTPLWIKGGVLTGILTYPLFSLSSFLGDFWKEYLYFWQEVIGIKLIDGVGWITLPTDSGFGFILFSGMVIGFVIGLVISYWKKHPNV